MASETWPCAVNLNALESRFLRICCSRLESVVNARGSAESMSTWNARFFESATCRNVRSMLSLSEANVISSASTVTVPDSIFDKSRMSLMSVSRSVPAEWMFLAKSTCFGDRLPKPLSLSCWPRIRIELSGVRSSCDMFARNSDLYFDVSASSAAFSSSARRACSTSMFFRSTSTFCSASCLAFDASSSFVCCSSLCRVCSSVVSCCDCCSRFSVCIVASIVLSTTPIDCVSCSSSVRCVVVNG